MTLNEYLAHWKRTAYDSLLAGVAPEGFALDGARFADLKERGKPTMGTTVLAPHEISFEFIYGLEDGESEVLSLKQVPPERIVHLPVPGWVVENIWQGDVQGSFHFESDALALVEQFRAETGAESNKKWFERQQPKRRE